MTCPTLEHQSVLTVHCHSLAGTQGEVHGKDSAVRGHSQITRMGEAVNSDHTLVDKARKLHLVMAWRGVTAG